VPPPFFRPPFGEISPRLLWWMRRQRRGPIVLWSRVLGGDESTIIRSADDIRRELAQEALRAGEIVVLHDTNEGTGTVGGLTALVEHLDRLSSRSVTLEALLQGARA
jgi:peptidoglycan/xylan/chitin deacetylase (PgdA/CDA1 family)